jgi:hypothetical protein
VNRVWETYMVHASVDRRGAQVGVGSRGTNCQVLFDQSFSDGGVDGSTGNSEMK